MPNFTNSTLNLTNNKTFWPFENVKINIKDNQHVNNELGNSPPC